RVHPKTDLQVVAAHHRRITDEVFGIGVRRDADVRNIEQPAATCGSWSPLDTVESRLSEECALGQVADVSRGRVRIPRADQPDDGCWNDRNEENACAGRSRTRACEQSHN